MNALQVGSLVEPPVDVETRLLVSAVLVLAVVLAAWLSRLAVRRIESEAYARVGNVLAAIGVVALVLLAGAGLLSVWGVTGELVTTLEFFGSWLDIDDPVRLAANVVFTVFVLMSTYLLTGVVKRFIHEFTEGRGAITRHQTELAFRSTQVTMYVLAVVIVFGIWQVNLGGLLVGAGFLGIVVGMAARHTLGSLVAGFVLMFSRPFEIGDWVQIGDREGIVTEISIVDTRIQTFDGEYAMIPNDMVSSNEIVNRTRKGRLRIQVDVGVDYDTDLRRAMEVATGAMREVDEILTVPQPQSVLKEFGASSIVLELRFWIDKPSARRKWRAQTAVIAAIKAAFDDEGIKIPYPQRELMGRVEEGGFRLAETASVEPPEPAPDGGER